MEISAESEAEHGIREEGMKEGDGCEEPAIGTSVKRKGSSLSSDGGEDIQQSGQDATAESSPTEPRLGNLHKRRASASPQKFNKGRSEPLPLKTETRHGPPHKKARLDANLEISYDATGTPRISAFAPRVKNAEETANQAHPRTATSLPTSNTLQVPTRTPGSSEPYIAASYLINASRSSHDGKAKFGLLHSICRDNDLLLHLVSFLTIPSLVSLYAISKPFHFLFNRHHTAFILSIMRTWAPNADKIYPWRCYKHLCAKDPSKRQKVRLEGREADVRRRWDDLRDVPSLRWLQMVVSRPL